MSLIIIGKVSLASLGAGAFVVGGFFLHRFLNPTVEIYGIVTNKSADGKTGKKFQCQIEHTEQQSTPTTFECEIQKDTKLSSETTYNHAELSTLADGVDWKAIEDSEIKLDDKKIYKIIISAIDFTAHQADLKTQNIKVVGGTSSASLVEIVPMLLVNGSTKTFLGSTNSFVGQADKEIDNISEHKCAWATSSSTVSDLKTCKIFPFVFGDASAGQGATDSKISDLTFTQAETTATATKKDHYYLIKFTNPDSDSKALSSFVDTEIIYAKDNGSGDETLTFGKISAVLVVDDQLLILKQQTAA